MLQNKDFFFVLIARTKRTNTLCSSDTLELNCISLWGFFVTKNSCRIWRFSSLIIKEVMLCLHCMLPHNLCCFIRVLHHNTISHSLYFEKSFNSSHYWILIHNSLAVLVISCRIIFIPFNSPYHQYLFPYQWYSANNNNNKYYLAKQKKKKTLHQEFFTKKKYNNNAVLYQASSAASAEYQKKHFFI